MGLDYPLKRKNGLSYSAPPSMTKTSFLTSAPGDGNLGRADEVRGKIFAQVIVEVIFGEVAQKLKLIIPE
jgi:hypothetical protein